MLKWNAVQYSCLLQIMGYLAMVVIILCMCFILEMGIDGDRSLVAGRSQREKRRSYKDLLREEEEIAAQVRKSSKKRLKVRTAHTHKQLRALILLVVRRN